MEVMAEGRWLEDDNDRNKTGIGIEDVWRQDCRLEWLKDPKACEVGAQDGPWSQGLEKFHQYRSPAKVAG